MDESARLMEIKKRYAIETGPRERATVLLVGCGGTGSFAALHLARLAWTAGQNGQRVRLMFVDPDMVELRNVGRQNFCPAEVGQPKALTLASRYSLAFGLDIGAVVDRFHGKMIGSVQRPGEFVLVVGAVDTPAARRQIMEAFRKELKDGIIMPRARLWWLDAGNDAASGQVLLGNSLAHEPVISPVLERCVELPLPGVQEPDLLAVPARPVEAASCAELMTRDVQSLMINQAMAGWLAVYAYRLLISRDLDLMATYIDQATGATRSVAITGGMMAEMDVSEAEHQAARRRAQREATAWAREAGYTAVSPFEEEEPEVWVTCPECGADIIEGEDEIEGIVTGIVFCPECNWRVTREEFERLREDLIEQNLTMVDEDA